VVRRAIEAKYGNIQPQDWDEVAQGLLGVVSPIGATAKEIGGTLIPQTVKPEVQWMANHDFFRDMPIESPTMERRLPQDRYYPWTSQVARAAGRATGQSPVKIERYVSDRFGPLSQELMHGADALLAKAGVMEKPMAEGTDPARAVIDRFTKARGGAVQNRIFELKAEMKKAYAEAWTANVRDLPEFKAMPYEEQMKQLQSIVSRSNSHFDSIDKEEWYQQLPDDEKAQVLQRIHDDLMQQIGRKQ
jgi:hypothetical protein